MKFWRIWNGWFKLNLAAEMAYRLNFLLKTIAFVVFDTFGPLLALIIYGVSNGIPGWSFEEFLLLQGTFILSFGLVHLFFWGFSGRVIEAVRQGSYDVDLIRPANPLLLALATGSDLDGLPRVIVGLAISSIALVKLGWVFNIFNLLAYGILIVAAVLFLLSLQIIIAALSFLFVKSYTMMHIFDILNDFGKSPLTIYGPFGTIIFTFVLPLGLTAFYPASAILGRLSFIQVAELVSVAIAVFTFSVGIWHLGIRKYASAGG